MIRTTTRKAWKAIREITIQVISIVLASEAIDLIREINIPWLS